MGEQGLKEVREGAGGVRECFCSLFLALRWRFSLKRAGQQAAAATTVWGSQQRKFHHSTIFAHKCVLFDKSSMQRKAKVTEFRVWWRRAFSVRAACPLLAGYRLMGSYFQHSCCNRFDDARTDHHAQDAFPGSGLMDCW